MTNLAPKNQQALPTPIGKARNPKDFASQNRFNYSTGFTLEQALEAALRKPLPAMASVCLAEAKAVAINWMLPAARLKALA